MPNKAVADEPCLGDGMNDFEVWWEPAADVLYVLAEVIPRLGITACEEINKALASVGSGYENCSDFRSHARRALHQINSYN